MAFTIITGNARLVIVGKGYNNKGGYKDGTFVGSGDGNGLQIINFFIDKDPEFIATLVYDDNLEPFPVGGARAFYNNGDWDYLDPQQDLQYTLSDGVDEFEFSTSSVPLVKPGLNQLIARFDGLNNVSRSVDIHVLDKLVAAEIEAGALVTHYSYDDHLDFRGLTLAVTFAYAGTLRYVIHSDDDTIVDSLSSDSWYLDAGIVKWSDLEMKSWSELKTWNDLIDDGTSEEDVYNPKTITTGAGDAVTTNATENANVNILDLGSEYLSRATDIDFGGTTFTVQYVFKNITVDGNTVKQFQHAKVTAKNTYADSNSQNVVFYIDETGVATADSSTKVEIMQSVDPDTMLITYSYSITKTKDDKTYTANVAVVLDDNIFQQIISSQALVGGNAITANVARAIELSLTCGYGIGQYVGYPFTAPVTKTIPFDYDARVVESVVTT